MTAKKIKVWTDKCDFCEQTKTACVLYELAAHYYYVKICLDCADMVRADLVGPSGGSQE